MLELQQLQTLNITSCSAFQLIHQRLYGEDGTLVSFAVDQARMQRDITALAMYFFSSNTPPARVENHYLQQAYAELGALSPSRKVLSTTLLQECHFRGMSDVRAGRCASCSCD